MVTMPPPPRAPFADWQDHHYDPHFGRAWWCNNAVIVAQMDVTHGTTEAASAYHRFEVAMLTRHADEVRESGGLYVLHDWRLISGYDTAARTYWQAQMRSRPKGYLRGSGVCIAKVAPLLKMAVQGANLVATLTRSGAVEVTDDIHMLVAKVHPHPVATFASVG